MKKETKQIISIILLAIALCFADSVFSQNVVRDKEGNFQAIPKTKKADQPTGKTYTDGKGQVYPVYESEKGKFYYFRTSLKTGTEYKCYLKIN